MLHSMDWHLFAENKALSWCNNQSMTKWKDHWHDKQSLRSSHFRGVTCLGWDGSWDNHRHKQSQMSIVPSSDCPVTFLRVTFISSNTHCKHHGRSVAKTLSLPNCLSTYLKSFNALGIFDTRKSWLWNTSERSTGQKYSLWFQNCQRIRKRE